MAHVGLAGAADSAVWRYGFAHDFAVVTMNARDFLRLATGVPLHPGLIVLRESGLTAKSCGRASLRSWTVSSRSTNLSSTVSSRFGASAGSTSAIFPRIHEHAIAVEIVIAEKPARGQPPASAGSRLGGSATDLEA